MSLIEKKRVFPMRFRRLTVGCGIQGGDCLALAVGGRQDAWRIDWGMYGKLGDRHFAKRLSSKVWRRDLWTPPADAAAEQETVVCAIDLSLRRVDDKPAAIGAREQVSAMRTQTLGRFSHAAEPSIIRGFSARGPDGKTHLVGAIARRKTIEEDFDGWRRVMGIINPHIGSNAVALTNFYLALYPEDYRKAKPCRILALEGRETTHAVLLDDWRLIDSIQYQMMANQRLDAALMDQWIKFFRGRHSLADAPMPCIVETMDDRTTDAGHEVWRPFQDTAAVQMDEVLRALIEEHPDLAPLAFGMALQGF